MRFVLELGCDVDSVHVFDDLDVIAGADVFAAASAAELHFALEVLHVFLLLLSHSHFPLHYGLQLKLQDLRKRIVEKRKEKINPSALIGM